MNNSITTKQFNQLLHMAVDNYNLDPEQTYIEITWWDHIFRPLICEDCNQENSSLILVFGDSTCNSYEEFGTGEHFPVGFYVIPDAIDILNVTRRPMTISNFMDRRFTLDFDKVKFLFANSPINYYVDINPFKTRVYENRNKEHVLCFYVDDRDSGEWQPFDQLKARHIKLIQDI